MNNIVTDKVLLIMMSLFAVTSFVSVAGANFFLGISTLLFLLICYKNRKISISKDCFLYIKIVSIFALALFFSALLSGEIANGLKVWADYFMWRFMPFIIICNMFVSKVKVNQLLGVVICGFMITSLYVIYKGIFIYNGDISFGGAGGFAGHPMTFAGWSCIVLPILPLLIYENYSFKKLKYMYTVAFSIGCIASFYNATRGAWLALAIVIAIESVFFVFKNKKAILILGCIIAVISVFLAQNQFFNKRVSSIDDMKNVSNLSRFVMWKTAYDIFEKQPILGVGLGQYRVVYQNEYIKPKLEKKRESIKNLPGFEKLDKSEQELILTSKANIWDIKGLKTLKQVDRRRIRSEYLKESDINDYDNLAFLNHLTRLGHAHSNIFQMLAENGIIGLFGYVFAFGYILLSGLKNYLFNKNPYSLMILGSTTALVLQGLTEYNFGNGAVMKIYWLVLACLIVLASAYNKEKLKNTTK